MATTRERLYEAMAYNGIRPIDLSEKSGLTRGAISQYLSGKVTPKQDKIFILAQALNVSASWLMGKEVPMVDGQTGSSNTATTGCDILKAICKGYPKAQALVEKMRVTEDGDVVITGVDAGSAKVIGHAFRGAVAALDEAELTGDSSMEIVIS